MKKTFAICDAEEEYVQRLLEYVGEKKNIYLKTAAFTKEESLLEYSEKNELGILLLSEAMMNEKTKNIKAERVVLLKEERGNLPGIYKYQSAETILREAMSFYEAEKFASNLHEEWRDKKNLIGIFSPAGGTGKTSFALALGQLLAKNSAVLYMNLESFSGLGALLEMDFENSLSELLYYARQKGENLSEKLREFTVSLQKLDILPPVQSPEDIMDVNAGEWIRLINKIMNGSIYEQVILDIGVQIENIPALLEHCSIVLMPTRKDLPAQSRVLEFEEYLRQCNVNTDKVKKLQLPFLSAEETGRAYCESLLWSELGDYSRQLLNEVYQSGSYHRYI